MISDGDICRNKVIATPQGPQIYPLGYDRYAGGVVYDNKEFLLNTISHLLDENSMISVRSRAITLRSLNEDLISSSRVGWQSLAMGLPLFIVILIALILLKLREFKYAKKKESSSFKLTKEENEGYNLKKNAGASDGAAFNLDKENNEGFTLD